MPKKTAKQRSQKKPARKPVRTDVVPGGDAWTLSKKQRKVAVFFGVLVVAGLLWWGFKAVQTELQFRQDKKQYAATEASMQKVYDEMIAAAGAPTESHFSESCGHTSLKFKTGPLYCGFGYDYFYEVNTPQEGIKLALDSIDIMKKNQSTKDGGVPFVPLAQPEWGRQYDFDYEQGRVFGCGFNYKLKEKEQHNELVGMDNITIEPNFNKTTNAAYAAEISFGCHAGAAKALYQVEK